MSSGSSSLALGASYIIQAAINGDNVLTQHQRQQQHQLVANS